MILWVITGSREITDMQAACVLGALRAAANHDGSPTMIMHGDAPGVDSLVANNSERAALLPMPAQWTVAGKRAGPLRNEEMCAAAVAMRNCGWSVRVFAFPSGESSGTRGMIRLAQMYCLDTRVTEL